MPVERGPGQVYSMGASVDEDAARKERVLAYMQQQAAEQQLVRDASRTFADGLRWFCEHVKEQVALGRGEVELNDQLDDVGSVCDQWLASLPNSA